MVHGRLILSIFLGMKRECLPRPLAPSPLNVPDIHLVQVRFYTCDRATPIRYSQRVSI